MTSVPAAWSTTASQVGTVTGVRAPMRVGGRSIPSPSAMLGSLILAYATRTPPVTKAESPPLGWSV